MLYPLFIAILILVIFLLAIKIAVLRKSVREIHDAFQERLSVDTNTLLHLSSRDKALLALASDMNDQLCLLRKERHRYQQGDRELKEAVTNISHDLRTPLTALCGYLDLLKKEENRENAGRYLRQIENRVEALKSLTEELFQYSVITSAGELQLERVDLVRILEDSLLSFYGALQEKGIQPELHLPEEPVFRVLDKTALHRIFSNIISNAVKYAEGDLSVAMDGKGCITFSNSAKALNPVAVGRLFDRFYTVEARQNATGLGLSIARLLTERMGGRIEAAYCEHKLVIRLCFD